MKAVTRLDTLYLTLQLLFFNVSLQGNEVSFIGQIGRYALPLFLAYTTFKELFLYFRVGLKRPLIKASDRLVIGNGLTAQLLLAQQAKTSIHLTDEIIKSKHPRNISLNAYDFNSATAKLWHAEVICIATGNDQQNYSLLSDMVETGVSMTQKRIWIEYEKEHFLTLCLQYANKHQLLLQPINVKEAALRRYFRLHSPERAAMLRVKHSIDPGLPWFDQVAPHVVLVAGGSWAATFIRFTAVMAQYGNNARARITLVDPQAKEIIEKLSAQHAALAQKADQQNWQEIEMMACRVGGDKQGAGLGAFLPLIQLEACNVSGNALAAAMLLDLDRQHPVSQIVICGDDWDAGVQLAGQYLTNSRHLNAQSLIQCPFEMVLIQSQQGILPPGDEVHTMTVADTLFDHHPAFSAERYPGEWLDETAMRINYRYSKGNDQPINQDDMVNFWREQTAAFSWSSSRKASDHFSIKLNLLKAYDPCPSAASVEPYLEKLSRAEHARYRAERLLFGWRYCSIKNSQKKLNPTLIPFEDLPGIEIVKDEIVINEFKRWLTQLNEKQTN